VTQAAAVATYGLTDADLVFWRCSGRAEPAVVARNAGLPGCEVLSEGKGVTRGAVGAEVLHPSLCLGDVRQMASGDPPQGGVQVKVLKPLVPSAHYREMRGVAIDELPQRRQRLPHSQIDDQALVVSEPRTPVASPSSVCMRQTKPGVDSA
jgi:hypothetical protein